METFTVPTSVAEGRRENPSSRSLPGDSQLDYASISNADSTQRSPRARRRSWKFLALPDRKPSRLVTLGVFPVLILFPSFLLSKIDHVNCSKALHQPSKFHIGYSPEWVGDGYGPISAEARCFFRAGVSLAEQSAQACFTSRPDIIARHARKWLYPRSFLLPHSGLPKVSHRAVTSGRVVVSS
jgi:hypothetical protein